MMIEDTRNQDAFGLVAVLIFILLIASVITPLAAVSRTGVLSSGYLVERTSFELAAPWISKLMGFALQGGHISSMGQKCEKDDKTFLLGLQDQSGLIGLNGADEELLTLGFLALGVPDGEARRLSKRIVSAREGGFGQDGSPEISNATRTYANVNELQETLPGFVRAASELEDVFTVYNRTDVLDEDKASEPLRRVLAKARVASRSGSGAGGFQHVRIVFAAFENGRQQGFVFRGMMERQDVGLPRIVEQEFSVATRPDFADYLSAGIPCDASLGKLLGGLE